jgi:diguanylate cyclase (GGDEF)-like protein/excisionase family DNA binding protein
MAGNGSHSDWLRIAQAADLLAVSQSTVRRWADRGRLACRRTPSGERRFRSVDIESLRAIDSARSGRTQEPYRLLFETSLELASSLELTEVLQSAARRLSTVLAIPDCDIYRLSESESLVCVASASRGVLDTSWVGYEAVPPEWPCYRLALTSRRPVIVSSLADTRLSDVERTAMRRYDQRSSLVLPLVVRRATIGIVDLSDHVDRTFTDEQVALAEQACQLVALTLDHAELYERVKSLHLGNLRALSSALSAKDYYTLGHAGRVAAYAVMLARELGWPEARLEQLQDAAFLHDIGKIGVSDRVLLKPGPLTSEEWELIHQHPGISAEIARPLFDDELVAGIRHHHERFDGSGYPDGLAGANIPEVARLLCVVDCYDAMSCQRPYRPALSYSECLAELRRNLGSQFDPVMVAAFRRVLGHLRRRRADAEALAGQAVALVDPAAHSRLTTRADEARPEYRVMVAALRAFRNAHPQVRYITTFTLADEGCMAVLDTGDSEDEVSHLGDRWLAQDELEAVLVGEHLEVNVVNADDFGVWVTGTAPVHDVDGHVVAALTVDIPAVEQATRRGAVERSHTLAAMLQAAAIRYSRAEIEAITDGLTGLYNHRYLHERLEEELERAQRHGEQLSLLFYDCDQFKAYNDRHGHKVGDSALARIARVTESCSRRIDLAARYGGEEFVLALVDTGPAGALTVAERIRAEVESSSALTAHPLTVSIGIATYPDDATAKDELLDKADWAMYAAKRAGRNRVLAFNDGLVAQDTWLSRRGG